VVELTASQAKRPLDSLLMNMTPRIWSLFFAGLVASGASAQQAGLPVIPLNAGLHVIQAEVANTPATRATGLMYRKSMEANRGMLFDFEVAGNHCMWMRNTFIPLSVAFMEESGRIVNIADMTPHDETSHCASGPARYALEMNRGWFAGKGVKPGAKVGGLDKLPKPK
jgi:uncharacterized protein